MDTPRTRTPRPSAARLKQRRFEQNGEQRTVTELDVEEVGPSLRYASAKAVKANRSGTGHRGRSAGRQGTVHRGRAAVWIWNGVPDQVKGATISLVGTPVWRLSRRCREPCRPTQSAASETPDRVMAI